HVGASDKQQQAHCREQRQQSVAKPAHHHVGQVLRMDVELFRVAVGINLRQTSSYDSEIVFNVSQADARFAPPLKEEIRAGSIRFAEVGIVRVPDIAPK